MSSNSTTGEQLAQQADEKLNLPPTPQRDDSSARRYAKTSHLVGQNQQDFYPKHEADEDPEISNASQETRRARALTADNLERIPDADQLAPGIRLPGQVVASNHHRDVDFQTSSDADGGAQSLETGQTSVGAFGEGGAPVPGVPPELDPRTSSFRPHSPGAASVFSVAVQPPASPKAPSVMDVSEPMSPYIDPSNSRDRGSLPVGSSASATAGSSYSASARGSSPPLSTGFGPDISHARSAGGPGPSTLSRTVASVTPSEAGSVSSSGTGGGLGSVGTADDAELALRAAYIERQRMRERELLGGEAGVGGNSISNFPPRGSTPLAFQQPGLSARLGEEQYSRAGSTAATIGTSSPPPSLSGSEIPDGVAPPSRRGSMDSTETLGSIRAPPSDFGGAAPFELGSGIESRRMSRGPSNGGGGGGVAGESEGFFKSTGLDEDGDQVMDHGLDEDGVVDLVIGSDQPEVESSNAVAADTSTTLSR
ncbi:hypothetical protein IE53DRAFT_370547 [Violaceomyces palustris]|uniref:Uncharacterized protein n=1 Tax=Violaceomyces palustris TaxID=1673888 RepID=A0ACD0NRN7_9BASI|nr:hypothetical protein IE53DRAFT_370547 [Violaceomyces palustris]